MKNKKQFFGVLFSVLISVFLVGIVVYATTISTDITTVDLTATGDVSITDDLFVTSKASISSDFVVGGVASMGAGIVLDDATIGIDFSGGIFDTEIVMSNGARIVSASATAGIKIEDNIVEADDTMLYLSGEYQNVSDGVRKGMLWIYAGRSPLIPMTSWGGNADVGIKIEVLNYANNTIARGASRGMDINVRNKGSYTGTQSWIDGIYLTAENESGGTLAQSIVAQFNLKNNGVINTSHYGVLIQDQSQGTNPTDTVMLKLDTSNNAVGTTRTGIELANSGGTGYDYGIDMDSATIATADIRLSGGPTIFSGTASPSADCTDGSIYLRTGTASIGLAFNVCDATNTWTSLASAGFEW